VNWMTRAAWVNPGSGIDWVKVAAHNIGQLYVAANAGNAPELIRECRARKPSMPVGIFEDPHWYPATGGTPNGFAEKVSADIERLIPGRGNPVMVDLELLAFGWQQTFVTAYRALHPQRETSVTVAPFQAPVLALPSFAQHGFHVYAQTYYGDMSPADGPAVMQELARCFPPDRLHPFYAGERFPSDARDGAVFTLDRLP